MCRECQELTGALPEVAAHLGPREDELLYGRAGLLYALLYTRRHVGDDAVPDSLLYDLAQQIIEAGEQPSTEIVYWWHSCMRKVARVVWRAQQDEVQCLLCLMN